MDILYIIGKNTSKCDNWELRFSLRSIAQHGKNIDRVFVAGYCPEWLSDEIIKVPFEQPNKTCISSGQKVFNIAETIIHVIENTDISDEFLVSMDDHFYVRDVDFNNYPYYSKVIAYNDGCNKDILPSKCRPDAEDYRHFMVKSRQFLEANGLSIINCVLHRNMHVNKSIVSELYPFINEFRKKKEWDCEFFLLVLNYQYSKTPINFKPIKDVKINSANYWWKSDSGQTEVFSTCDFYYKSALFVLIQGIFPDKCKFEK